KKKVQPTKKRSSSENCTLQKRALQKVDRSEIIPVDTEHKSFVAINQETGTPWHFIFIDNTSHSLGTYASPYPTLLEAQNKAGANDALYAFPGSGAAYDTASSGHSGLQLKNNQRFLGSATGHTVDSQYGPISILALSSAMPNLTNSLSQSSVITLADQSVVTGFHFQGNDIKHAIVGNNNKGTVIERNVIAVSSSTPGDAAVHIESSDNTTENVIRFNSFRNSNKNSIKVKGRGTYSNNIFRKIDTPHDYTAIEIEGGKTIVYRNTFQGITTGGDFVGCSISTTEKGASITISKNTFTMVDTAGDYYGYTISSTKDNSPITVSDHTFYNCDAGNDFYGFHDISSTGENSGIDFDGSTISYCNATAGNFYGFYNISSKGAYSPISTLNSPSIENCTAGTDFYGFLDVSSTGDYSPIDLSAQFIGYCSAGTDFYGWNEIFSKGMDSFITFDTNTLQNSAAKSGDFYGWNTVYSEGTGFKSNDLDKPEVPNKIEFSSNTIIGCTATSDFYGWKEIYSKGYLTSIILTKNQINTCTANSNFYGWNEIYSDASSCPITLDNNNITGDQNKFTAGINFYGWNDIEAKKDSSPIKLSTNTINICGAKGDFYGWKGISSTEYGSSITADHNKIEGCQKVNGDFYGFDTISATDTLFTFTNNFFNSSFAVGKFYGVSNVDVESLTFSGNTFQNCKSTNGTFQGLSASITTLSNAHSTISKNEFVANSPSTADAPDMEITYTAETAFSPCLTLTSNTVLSQPDISINITNDSLKTLTLDQSLNDATVTTDGDGDVTDGPCSS
ncbi:MAG: hypothetical protein NTZ52_02220, partial [Chlamydiae bacterium]|nr:hypothetical protein [Chlamydiota bacterium]